MRRITKSREPSSFAAYRRQKDAVFDGSNKADLRKSLVKEQGGLCCYCMCRIPEIDSKFPGMKIEHFKSYSKYTSERLVYRNLFGACWGNGQERMVNGSLPQTCDTFRSRGNEDITSFNLLTTDLESDIRYLSNGTIQAQNAFIDRDINDILNLNDQSLRSRREGVRAGISNRLRQLNVKGKVTPKAIRDLIEGYKSRDAMGSFKEFYPVAVYYLNSKLKQFR